MTHDGNGMLLLDLLGLPEDAHHTLQRIAPKLEIYQAENGSETYRELLPRADIIVGWPPVDDLAQADRLKWLQLGSAGADRYWQKTPRQVQLTNAVGVFGIPIAEHVLALMLAMVRQVHHDVRAAQQREWNAHHYQRGELCGSVCGIVGLGDIGLEVAKRAKAFGMTVIAVKRTADEKPGCVDELWEQDGLDELLRRSDHVVVCLPGTEQTHHLLSRERLATMKPGSYLYNIGRGRIIDEQAMIELLQTGHLAGAGLDVFEKEPLPEDSPLWSLPNVIITPHRAGQTPRHRHRLAAIVEDNLRRLLQGQPLRNLVDRELGY